MTIKSDFSSFDLDCMQRAYELAEQAAHNAEVPVGAVIADEAQQIIIGEGFNQPIANNDASAHAEIIAIRNAGNHIKNYRLTGTTMYVTLEPCMMCTGAMLHARIKRLVFAAADPKSGVVVNTARLLDSNAWNHQISYEQGLLAAPSSAILRSFFKDKRKK